MARSILEHGRYTLLGVGTLHQRVRKDHMQYAREILVCPFLEVHQLIV